MQATIAALLAVAVGVSLARGGDPTDPAIWVTDLTAETTLAADLQLPHETYCLDVVYDVVPGLGNSTQLAANLPITGVSVSVVNYGSHATYERVGVYLPNLVLDSSGRTPDLSQPIVELRHPPNPSPPLFAFVDFDTPEGAIPPDPPSGFGICDDGTIENASVIQDPGGPADYVNNSFGDGTGQNGIVELTISVMDFGTSFPPLFPSAGVSKCQSRRRPDRQHAGHLRLRVARDHRAFHVSARGARDHVRSVHEPSHAIAIPGGALSTHVHSWLQLPPGEPGELMFGLDDSWPPRGCSFYTSDGYTTPAVSVSWQDVGLRVKTN